MTRTRASTELDGWIEQASTRLVALLAQSVARAAAAIWAATNKPWSNGQTEGQINRLKLIKRLIYGRAKFGLLETCFVGAV